jgi:hypothetical protein
MQPDRAQHTVKREGEVRDDGRSVQVPDVRQDILESRRLLWTADEEGLNLSLSPGGGRRQDAAATRAEQPAPRVARRGHEPRPAPRGPGPRTIRAGEGQDRSGARSSALLSSSSLLRGAPSPPSPASLARGEHGTFSCSGPTGGPDRERCVGLPPRGRPAVKPEPSVMAPGPSTGRARRCSRAPWSLRSAG